MAFCGKNVCRTFVVLLSLAVLVCIMKYPIERFTNGRSKAVAPSVAEPLFWADLGSSRYAFATFLGNNTQSNSPDDEQDPYFMGVRQLTYKLLHAGSARLSHIPLLVLCTSAVSVSKRARLQADGAIIVPVQDITSDMLRTDEPRWQDMLTKLRLFDLEGYDKVCYLDADTFLTENIKSIFQDPATWPRYTASDLSQQRLDEAPLPGSYMIAGFNDYTISEYLNAGLLGFSPSHAMFEYYMSLLDKSDRFDPPGYMDQSLLNYAHRPDGNMPWTELSPKWYASVHHDKYWRCETSGCPNEDYAIGEQWMAQRAETRRYWSLYDAA